MSVETINETTQYLTFRLEEETYALDISRVHSVLDFDKVTKVPKTPDFMRGVINLRGSVVPIVDLKLKFDLSETEKTIDTCIVISEVELEGEKTVLGILADTVEEVITMEPDKIEPAPRIGTKVNTEFIKGMGKRDENFVIILDIYKIFSVEELEMVQGASGTQKKTEENAVKAKKSSTKRKKEEAVTA